MAPKEIRGANKIKSVNMTWRGKGAQGDGTDAINRI